MKKAVFAIVVALVVAAGGIAVAISAGQPGTTPPPTYSQEGLHQAALMTQEMSIPTADGHMFHGQTVDAQLRTSLDDPQFVAQLEAHVAAMNRMLGLRTP